MTHTYVDLSVFFEVFLFHEITWTKYQKYSSLLYNGFSLRVSEKDRVTYIHLSVMVVNTEQLLQKVA